MESRGNTLERVTKTTTTQREGEEHARAAQAEPVGIQELRELAELAGVPLKEEVRRISFDCIQREGILCEITQG